MGKGKYLSQSEQILVRELKSRGESNRKIARVIHRSEAAIRNLLKKGKTYGVKKKTKGNSKITNRVRNQIIQMGDSGNFSAAQIKQEMGLSISKRRVRQILHGSGHLKYTKKAKKPNLQPAHISARLNFAKKYMSWTTEWDNVIFSDEKKFNLDGPDCTAYYWHDLRKSPQVKLSRNFGGGTLMCWAAFSIHGKTPIATISTRMNSGKYLELLEDVLIPFTEDVMPENFVFQQDNAAIHVSKQSLKWFSERDISLLDWPARSPDLNPIENLWGILARQVYKGGRQFKTVRELESAVREAWSLIPDTTLQKLVKSMPNRIFETIQKNGKQTKY